MPASDKCKKIKLRGKNIGNNFQLISSAQKGKFIVPSYTVGSDYIKVLLDRCLSSGITVTRIRESSSLCPKGSTGLGGYALMLRKYSKSNYVNFKIQFTI